MLDLVALGLGIVLYILLLFASKKGWVSLPTGWEFEGIFLLYKTQAGLQFIENLANKYKRFWKYLGTTGFIVVLILLFLATAFVVVTGITSILNPPEQTMESPANYLIIPGVNDFLPLSVGLEIIIGLVIGMIVHEGGHAILSRVGSIELDSAGLVFISILPIGAFVEPIEESQERAPRMDRLRMFAAGITNNIIATFITLALLFFIGSMIIPVQGAAVGGVLDGSSAEEKGLQSGDVIVSVDGETITSNRDYQEALMENSQSPITITTNDGAEHAISRTVFLQRTIETQFTPSTIYQPSDNIIMINNMEVSTIHDVHDAFDMDSHHATIETEAGGSEVPIGGLATLQPGSPLVSLTDLDEGDNIVIVDVEGARTTTSEAVRTEFNNRSGEIQITYYTANSSEPTSITLEQPRINAVLYEGYTGLSFTDTGIALYPTETFLTIFSPTTTDYSWIQWLVLFFFGPFATLIGLEHNFFGFAGIAAEFYTSSVGRTWLVFLLANIFYWTAWININLALFNCLPTYMLDGGHILKDSASIVGEKLGQDPDVFSKHITRYVKAITLISLLAMMFASTSF